MGGEVGGRRYLTVEANLCVRSVSGALAFASREYPLPPAEGKGEGKFCTLKRALSSKEEALR